jgi:hypothetical protein
MFPPAPAMALAASPNASGSIVVPTIVTAAVGCVGSGASSTTSKSICKPDSQPKKSRSFNVDLLSSAAKRMSSVSRPRTTTCWTS